MPISLDVAGFAKSLHGACILSLLAGLTLVASFAPFHIWPLAFLSVAVLFYLCWQTTAKRAFTLGFVYGLGVYLAGVSWVYVSLSTYGGMPLWMGVISVLGFSSLLSVFIALACFSANYLTRPGSLLRIFALALCWTLFEWGKSWVLTGFPWLDLGYSQTNSWFFSFAPVGGVYLISFMVAIVSGLFIAVAMNKQRIIALVAITFIMLCAQAFSYVGWSSPTGKELNVGIVQGNVEINKKWQAQYRDGVIAKLFGLSQELHNRSASENQSSLDLVVWPETAMPLYYQQTDEQFWLNASPKATAFITGLMDSPNYPNSYNAAVLSCEGAQQVYRKRHLVPFGEYLPLRFLFDWVLVYLNLPMSDLSFGEGGKELSCGDSLKIGLSICYEDTFAAEMREYSGDATLLVNISEDAWFGDSLAPHQRLQIAQMRAKELSRPLLRSANTGPSVIINHEGQVVARTKQFVATSLLGKVQPQIGETLFKRFGNWIVWVCMGLFTVMTMLRIRDNTYSRFES